MYYFFYSCRKLAVSTESDEKYFENPTYDGISTSTTVLSSTPGLNVPATHQQKQVFPRDIHSMYDAVNTKSPKTTRRGQTYDVLNWGKANGINILTCRIVIL